jgi:hypothetical protein
MTLRISRRPFYFLELNRLALYVFGLNLFVFFLAVPHSWDDSSKRYHKHTDTNIIIHYSFSLCQTLFLSFSLWPMTTAEEERLKELNRIRVKRCRDKKAAKEKEKAAKEKERKEKRNARDRERYARNKAKAMSSAGESNNNSNIGTPVVDRALMESLLDRLDTATREAQASFNRQYEIGMNAMNQNSRQQNATMQEAAQQHLIASVAQRDVHIQQFNSIVQQFTPGGSAMMRNVESATDIMNNYYQGRRNLSADLASVASPAASAPTIESSFSTVAASSLLLDGRRDVASHFGSPQGNNNMASASATVNKRTQDDATQVPDLQMGGENSSASSNRRIVKATKPHGTAPSLLQQSVDILKPTDGMNHDYSRSNKKQRPIVDTNTTTTTAKSGGPVFGVGSFAALPSNSVGMNVPSPSYTSSFVPSNEIQFSMGVGGPIPGHRNNNNGGNSRPRNNTNHIRTSTPLAQQQKQPSFLLFGSQSATQQQQDPGQQSNQQIDDDDL